MKKYVNFFIMIIIVVTFRNGTVKEYDTDSYFFGRAWGRCTTLSIYKKGYDDGMVSINKKIAEFPCDVILSVEKK